VLPGEIPISNAKRNRWRRPLGGLVVGASCIIFVLVIVISYYNGLYLSTTCSMGISDPGNKRVISLSMFPESIDFESNTISLNWKIIGDSGCFPYSGVDCSDVDIIMQNIQSSRPSTPMNALPNPTTYRWSPKGDSVTQNASFPLTSLTTSYPLVMGVLMTHVLQHYPLDIYRIECRLRGLNSLTGVDVDVRVMLCPGYTAGSLDIKFESPENAAVSIRISRRQLVWGYAFVIMVAIWMITLIFAFVAAHAVIFGSDRRVDVLVVPVGALFAFPQLRSTLPGIPEVSILDYVCFLPCLGVLSFSAALTLAVIMFTDHAKDRDSLVFKILCCSRPAKSTEPKIMSIGSTWAV